MTFDDFSLNGAVKRAVSDLGYSQPTPIQEQSIPILLEGHDLIGLSQTGSGKTAAYGLPALNRVDPEPDAKYPQVLILTPTRELAMQVADELHKFSKYTERIHITAVYGGQPINHQVARVRSGCQILVGTPGRIMDLLGRKVLRFQNLKTVILDEADEMLNRGFREDIESILSKAPTKRQTVLFSATMPQPIRDITGTYLTDPITVKIADGEQTAVQVEQMYFEVASSCKKDALSLLLQAYEPRRSLVFCNTKKMVDEVCADLTERGFMAEKLHGDLKQEQRTSVMNRYKNGGFPILVATDVAARGIDVNDIDIVFNYDLPDDPDFYVHRIGRTARAGKNGQSITLIHQKNQIETLRCMARQTHSTVSRRELPTVRSLIKQTNGRFISEIVDYATVHDTADSEAVLTALHERGLNDHVVAVTLLHMIIEENGLKKGTVDVPMGSIETAVDTVETKKPTRRTARRVLNEKAVEKFKDVDMATIIISIGRQDKVAPKHVLGAIAGESGLPGSIMGTIDIGERTTTVEVPRQLRTRIVKALNKKTVKGKTVTVKACK